MTYSSDSLCRRGFTLIEVLLVISLIGLASGLVAPKLFSVYKKIQVQSEEKEFYNFLNSASYRAFIRNCKIKVTLDKEKVLVGDKTVLSLKHLFLAQTELIFLSSGICDKKEILYHAAGEKRLMSPPGL